MNRDRQWKGPTRLFLAGAVAAALMFALVLLTMQPESVNAQDSDSGMTSNELAANGPMPGDLSKVDEEWECSQQVDNPGYFKSLNGAEVADSTRSQLFPCASFLGTMTGTNQVFAYRFPAENDFYGVLFMNNRRPGELYLSGGNNPPATGTVPPGPYVAKVDATTGKEVWRTYLENANVSGAWVGASNLNILEDGPVVISVGNALYKLNGETGLIMQRVALPTGQAPADGSNHKHVTIAPDGTIIVKNQNRATPCDIQGTLAMFQCPGGIDASPPANIAAVNPDTFEVYDNIDVPENTATPHVVTTMNDGRIAIYAPGAVEAVYRFIWDPDTKTLSQDTDWVVSILEDGQTTGDAPGILGDWVVIQTNGLPTTEAASSVVAINQDDPTQITRVYPFGTDLPTGQSWAPPKSAVDAENNMVYSADQNMMMIAGISLDPDSGEMTTTWTLDGATTALQALYGPADQRVLGTARAEADVTLDELNNTSSPTYTQQALWLNALTGEVLAESDYFEPMGFNTMLTPGYGGRFYYPTNEGIIVFQVMPAADESADAASSASDTASDTTSDAASTETEPAVSAQYYTDTLEVRYCELVLNYDDRAEIYNSTGLSDCPDDQWDNLDTDSIAATYGANSVDKNGPQYWMTDNLTLYGSEPFDLGGIEMRFGATLPPPAPGGSSDPPPYSIFSPTKTQYNEYNTGSTVYELVDPDGNVYVLQARKNTVSADSLATLGDLLNLPEGWEYRTVVLDADLVFNMTSDMAIPSTADDFGQIYVQILDE